MGRTAKYLTHDERLAARRARRAERYRDPSVVQARSQENRRAYAKKRLQVNADVALPPSAQSLTTSPIAIEDADTFVRFRNTFCITTLEGTGISDPQLEPLGRPPPYPPKIIVPIDFEKDWGQLCSALYGYQIRKYLETQRELLSRYRTQPKLTISSYLVQQFQLLQEALSNFNSKARRIAADGDPVSEHLCYHNAKWTAFKMMYAQEDLEALAKNDESYVDIMHNRTVALERLCEDTSI